MDWLLGGLRKGELWREGRKILDRSLRPGATILYRQTMQENICEYLAWLLATPKEFRSHTSLLVVTRPLIMPPLIDYAAFRENLTCPSHMDMTRRRVTI
jgi:hypothetical protein